MTATHRALLFLYQTAGRDGVSCYNVGGVAWPDHVLRGSRGVSSNGGGGFAAQMLLGRFKSARLVEHAPSEGSSRGRLTVKGLHEVRRLVDRPSAKEAKVAKAKAAKTESGGAIVSDPDPCTCGRAPEEHGSDPKYPGSTSCTECDCVAYEADPKAT